MRSLLEIMVNLVGQLGLRSRVVNDDWNEDGTLCTGSKSTEAVDKPPIFRSRTQLQPTNSTWSTINGRDDSCTAVASKLIATLSRLQPSAA